jgi:hypothetical protein
MNANEPDVREALRRYAEGFDMAGTPPATTREAIGRRRTRNGAIAAVASATVAGVLAVSALLLPSDGPSPAGPGGTGTEGVAEMSYVLVDSQVASERDAPAWLTEHIECMREQGFDIPDPTQTADGWSITVDDPAAIGMGTEAWRRAAFVTCAPDQPLSGNFILGFPKDTVDAFVACMAGQGYDLPTPTLNKDGEYVFDLTNTEIDTAQAAWDEAVFVTCAIRPAAGGDG